LISDRINAVSSDDETNSDASTDSGGAVSGIRWPPFDSACRGDLAARRCSLSQPQALA
jgi:hypothetical protein